MADFQFELEDYEEPAAPAGGYKFELEEYTEGSYVPEAAKGVAAGAVEMTGTALKGLGGIRQEHMTRRKQEEARAKALEEADIENVGGYAVQPVTPETRKIIDKATESVELPDITKDPWFQAGQAATDWSKEQFKAATDFEQSWTRAISAGLGSTVPLVATSLVPGVGTALSVTAGVAASSGEAIDRAIAEGASKEQILEALKLGALPGFSEQLPIEVMLERVPLPAVGRVLGVVGKVLAKAAAEGGQEAVQQAAQNLIENYVYDPEQEIGEGVLESAVVGAAVGGIIGAGTSRATEKKVDDAPEVSSETQPEGNPVAPDAAKAAETSTPGGLGELPVAPPLDQPAAPVDPKAPTPAQAEPAGQPSPVKTGPGPVVTSPVGGVPVDVGAALGTAEEDEESDVFPEAWEPEEEAAETLTPAPRVETPTIDPAIAAVLGDINKILGRTPTQEPAAPASVPPAPLGPSPQGPAAAATPVEAAATAQEQPQAAPAPVVPVPAAAPQVPSPPVEFELVPVEGPPAPLGAPTAAFQPVPGVPAQPTAPAPPAPPPAAALTPAAEPTGLSPAGEAPPAPRVAVPAPVAGVPVPLSEQPTDIRKIGQLRGQLADALWTEARQDPELESWVGLPAIIDEAANTLSRQAAKITGVSPAEYVRDLLPATVARIRQRFDQERQAEAVAEETKARAAEEVSRQTAAEALVSGKPEERARGKKGAAGVAKQSRFSWMRLIKTEMAKPAAERDVDVVAYAEAKELRKKVQGSPTKRAKQTKAMEEAAERYTARLAEKEAGEAAVKKAAQEERRRKKAAAAPQPEALPKPEPTPSALPAEAPKPPPAPAPSPEEVEAAELAGQAKRNEEMSDALKPAIAGFTMPRLVTSADFAKGKDIIRQFNEQLTKALGKTKLRSRPAFGGEISSTGKPAPQQSVEENVAIYARQLEKRAQRAPFDAMTDFVMMMKFYEAGTKADIEHLRGMMTNEKSSFSRHEVKDEQVADEMAEDFGRFDQVGLQGKRVAARRMSPIEAPSGRAPSLEQLSDGVDTPIFVVHPETGAKIRMDSQSSMTGAEALRSVTRSWRTLFGLTHLIGPRLHNVMFRLTARQLKQLVGDIDIDFVSDVDMQQLSGKGRRWGGVYLSYDKAGRAKGIKPRILVNKDVYDALPAREKAQILVHEMTHAATSYALEHNIRGTDDIVSELRLAFAEQVQKLNGGKLPEGFRGAFTSNEEFVAEAFTDARFQQLLRAVPVPEISRSIAATIAGQHGHVTPTYWQAFLKMVGNALLPFKRKGQISFLEEVVRVGSQMMMSSAEQQADARSGVRPGLTVGQPAHPLHIQPMMANLGSTMENAGIRARTTGSLFSRASLKLQTTENMKRSAARIFADGADKFRKVADLFLGSAPHRREYMRAAAEKIEVLAREMGRDRKAFDKAADLVFDATKYQIDISVPLTDAKNKHIKGGTRNRHQRAAHARLHKQWQALPAETQKAFLDSIELLREQENQRIEKTVRDIVSTALRPAPGGLGVKLPPGVDANAVVQWVLNGGIDRQTGDPKNPKPTDRTAADEALHKALGKTAKSLTGTKEMRRIKGMYVPLMRWGRYFFTAKKKIATPAGAVLDKADDTGVHFIFKDKKDLDAYQDKADDLITHTRIEWVDPTTGKVTKKMNQYVDPKTGQLVIPDKRFRLVVQDRYMEMSDSEAELIKLQNEYGKNGFDKISDVTLVDHILHANDALLPRHINQLLRSVEQSHAGATTGNQSNVQAAILSGYIRQLGGNRAQHRRLKRATVGGHSTDFLRAMHSASSQMAAHLAHLDYAPAMAEAEADLQKFINDNRYAGSGMTAMRQAYYHELKVRMNAHNARTEATTGDRIVGSTMAASFINSLASPAYSIFNAIGGLTTGWAMLAGEFGAGSATKHMSKALMTLSPHKVYWDGLMETGKGIGSIAAAIPHLNKTYLDYVRSKTSHVPGFDKAITRVEELGFGSSDGLEAAGVGEIGLSKAERGLGRFAAIARAMPEAVEVVNRYSTLLANYTAALQAGKTEEQALEIAVTQVEKSQGGYAAENNPAYMSNKWAKLPLQFKKYPLMYAQAYFGAVAKMLGPNSDRATRVQGAKHFVYLSGVTVALAGTHGLPFMEVAKIFYLLAAMIGLSDGDWEEKENELQRFYDGGFEWLLGKKSNHEFYSEIVSYGLPRALWMETSSRLGNSSMLLFGSPRFGDQGLEWAPWILKHAVGAPGGMAGNFAAALTEWDPTKIPMPKFMKDALSTIEVLQEGTVNRFGRQTAPPPSYGEAALKAIGIKPASEARQWEAFGEGAESKVERKFKAERTKTMGKWTNADPRERPRIFREVIMPWNRAHPKREERIEMGDLRRSLSSRKSHERREKREQVMERFE